MNRELIVNTSPGGVEIALLENKRLVELHQEQTNTKFVVGDILLGRIKKVVPGLNAVFVDVGFKKDAFLHYTDLGPDVRTLLRITRMAISGNPRNHLISDFRYEKRIVKGGKIADVLKAKDPILVQILKEPISTKGPRLTCEITLPARNVVVTPFNDSIAISKKIGSFDERKRLKRLITSIKPKNAGVIVRTIAEGKMVAALHKDIIQQMDIWASVLKNLRHASGSKKVFSEVSKITSMLRDILNASFSRIITNDKASYNDLKDVIAQIAPEKEKIVHLYEGRVPMMEQLGITKMIKSAFGKTVTMSGGGYLVIEHTEALHVVDVNSGKKASSAENQEQNALQTNLEAAVEIAHQIRLREIGGIIIIDFIDMKNLTNRKAVNNKVKEAMAPDKAKKTILPLSKFCIMQITRQRVRQEIQIDTLEKCPSCKGTGKIQPSILITDEIAKGITHWLDEKKEKKLILQTHPYIDAFLRKGIMSQHMKWLIAYPTRFKLYSNDSYHLTEYRFFNEEMQELDESKPS